MVFDPLIYQGMAEMHDRHRDMRLDVDNMSYEVSVHFSFTILSLCTNFFKHGSFGNVGAIGTWGTHRRCEHWSKRRGDPESNETAQTYIIRCWLSPGHGALLCLSGKT